MVIIVCSNCNYIDGLVSVIMPSYNSKKYIRQAIESVLSQTYKYLELIVVDDYSSDNTVDIVKEYIRTDNRIVLICLEKNSGPAIARNCAIAKARGRYIAFLDSDDYWTENKLEIQINFMVKNNCYFSYHDFAYLNEKKHNMVTYVKVPSALDYYELLKGNSTGSCLTTCLDRKIIKKIHMSNEKHEVYICWLNILREYKINAFGINECLGFYRIGKQSVSSNKIKSAFWTWKVYRNSQQLSLILSFYYFFMYAIKAINKRK